MDSFSIEDCYPCKLAIGGILIGIGAGLGYKSRAFRTVPSRLFVLNGAIVFGALGVARILDKFPFRKRMKYPQYLEE